MIRSLLLGFAVNLLLLTALAAGDKDDYQCPGLPYEFDASRKGNISSPLYGKRPQYPINLYCQYKITAPVGHKIKVTFKDFDVDASSRCTQDQLAIYGKNYRGLLGTFCGKEVPRPLLSRGPTTILSSTDFFRVNSNVTSQFRKRAKKETTKLSKCFRSRKLSRDYREKSRLY